MRIRLTTRRQMIERARRKAQREVSKAIFPVMQSQGKRLERFLRRATLRKRLGKITLELPAGLDLDGGSMALMKVKELFKGDGGGNSMNFQSWEDWKKILVAILLLSLLGQADDLADIENDVWTSRGFPLLTFNADQLVQDYLLRTGRTMEDIAQTTFDHVQTIISEWYVTDKPFKDLMDDLDYWFSEERADLIADTEVGDLMSQVTFQLMQSNGWDQWIWDHKGEDIPCTNPIVVQGKSYNGCKELNGNKFRLGTPMPPAAAHPRCHCIATPVVPGE